MVVYFLLLLVSLLLYNKDKYNWKFALTIMIIMFALTAFRDISVGVDTESYMNKYKYNYNEYTNELLFNSTYSFIRNLGGTSQSWLFFVSLLIYLPFSVSICKYSKVPVMSALIFLTSSSLFFFDGMNGIRQWIACGFLLCSFLHRSSGQWRMAFFYVVIAIGFHLTSIIAIPFLFLPSFKLQRSVVLFSLIGVGVLGFFLLHVNLAEAFEIYGKLISGYEGAGSDKLEAYTRYSEMENTTNWKYYVFNILPLSVMCFFSYSDVSISQDYGSLKENKAKSLKRMINGDYLFFVFFIGTLLQNFLSTSIAYGHRIVFALLTTQLICLPNSYKEGTKKKRLHINCVLAFFVVWFIYYVIKTNGSRVGSTIPYKFFWE